MANRVAIVGVGQTHHVSKRIDVNIVEMVNEAVRAALADANLTIKDIDAVVTGNMELFEGNYLIDMWAVDGAGSYMKPGMKVNTGGTTGAAVAHCGHSHVASGVYDIVLAVAFEKQAEGDTRAGVNLGVDPIWSRWITTGAIGAFARVARDYMKRTGAREEHAAMVRVKAAKNACRNEFAHLRKPLTLEQVVTSRMLVTPLRLWDMCPTSDGACALIFASEKRARKVTNKPIWVDDWVVVHREERPMAVADISGEETTMEKASRLLYKRNGITSPRQQIDVSEIYEPSTWGELEWYERYHFCEPGESWKWIEKGVTDMEGEFPVNPSGGVLSTNPIGATAMIRIAEAALQLRGDAGQHQVSRPARTAFATAWGGSAWTVASLLRKY